jgi:hypothetical protein
MPGFSIGSAPLGSAGAPSSFHLRDRPWQVKGVFDKACARSAVFDPAAEFIVTTDPEI